MTMLPKEWEQLFPNLADWFGTPSPCRKSLCGGQHCNKSWDDHLSNWLEGHGLIRLPSEGSIFMKTEGDKFLCLLNAVDDQLCFSNCDDMRRKFEAAVKKDFDVDFLRQAHWCLQACVTQNADFLIALDQSSAQRSHAIDSSQHCLLPQSQMPITSDTVPFSHLVSSPPPSKTLPTTCSKQSD
jgi:hypothetical protein